MSPIIVIPSYLNSLKADRNKINTEESKQNNMKIDGKENSHQENFGWISQDS